jgi:hypothetical protein
MFYYFLNVVLPELSKVARVEVLAAVLPNR